MDTTVIEKKFSQIGARVKIAPPESNRWREPGPFSIDIRRDGDGEFFDIKVKKEIDMLVLDAQKDDRHLLLLVREPQNPKAKFLCGHDERAWFAAAIPEKGFPVSSVFTAKQALKPPELREFEAREGLKSNRAHKRHRRLDSGKKVHRQGEFMFIPEPGFQPVGGFKTNILKDEPLSRGAGKPHSAEYLVRFGGVPVWITSRNGSRKELTESERVQFLRDHPEAKSWVWTQRVMNPTVYAKGRISHSDHKTLDLGDIWHRVLLSTEDRAQSRSFLKFID